MVLCEPYDKITRKNAYGQILNTGIYKCLNDYSMHDYAPITNQTLDIK